MKEKNRQRQKKKKSRFVLLAAAVTALAVIGAIVYVTVFSENGIAPISTDKLLIRYMNYIPEQGYEQMYEMLNVEASGNISREDFVKRNSAIYEGIEVQNMKIEILKYDKETVTYKTSLDTVAGNICFENTAVFRKGENGCGLVWNDSLIYPHLSAGDKVRVSTTQAERGEILDRNGRVLAGEGAASSVGIVPGKLKNQDKAI